MYRVDWTRDAKKDRDIAIKNGLGAEVAKALETVRLNHTTPPKNTCGCSPGCRSFPDAKTSPAESSSHNP
jgi:hypothetical protein